MQRLFLSSNNNVIRLTTIDKTGFKNGYRRLETFSWDNLQQALSEMIPELTTTSKSKLSLNVLTQTHETYFRFITTRKDAASEEQIIEEIRKKLDDANLEDLYFSYQKIAPFVYQFVGIKKSFLDSLLNMTTNLGVQLESVIPWLLLLPKYVGTNESSIFIADVESSQVVALSELGGVFYCGTFTDQKSPEDLEELVQDLSVYKRSNPIKKVFTLNFPVLTLNQDYEVRPIELPNQDLMQTTGFEPNILVNSMIDYDPSIISSKVNLLNLLNLPVVQNRSALVPVIVAVSLVLLLVGGTFFVFGKNRNQANPTELAQANDNAQQVLSSDTTPQSSSSAPEQQIYKPEELVMRIENGAGVNGLAANTRDYLAAKNYKVLEIDTAQSQTEPTIFRFKKSKTVYKDLLTGDTKDVFPQVTVEDTLSEESAFDVLIIVGTSQKI